MNYYKKYLKYKSKYLLIKNQIGGEPIDNYFTTFFGITNDETLALNCFLKPILDQYWAEISICYGLPSPDHFIFKFVVNHPMEVNKYRENIVVFLSDHSPIHDERGRNNIISWNVGIGDEETVFNYLRPIECKKTGDAPGGKKVSVCPWFIKGQACHTRPGQPCSLRHPESFFFKKPAIDSPSDLKLLELKARLIVEYIKNYKGDQAIVHLQECSGRLYKKICDLLDKAGEYFCSDFVPQTLIDVSLDLTKSISYYTMPPESHDKSGLCTFVFFPDQQSITTIQLIPCITYVYPFPTPNPKKGIFSSHYNMTSRACKVIGIPSSDTFYNVHLDGNYGFTDLRTLLKNETTNYIFQAIQSTGLTTPIYNEFIKIVNANITKGFIKLIINTSIFGNSTVSSLVGSQIIIAGDFNQVFTEVGVNKGKLPNFYSKIIREAYVWTIAGENEIDYILYYTI